MNSSIDAIIDPIENAEIDEEIARLGQADLGFLGIEFERIDPEDDDILDHLVELSGPEAADLGYEIDQMEREIDEAHGSDWHEDAEDGNAAIPAKRGGLLVGSVALLTLLAGGTVEAGDEEAQSTQPLPVHAEPAADYEPVDLNEHRVLTITENGEIVTPEHAAPLISGEHIQVEDIALSQETRDMLAEQDELIQQNRANYEAAAEEYGIPWQIVAALHYREASNDPSKSILDGSPLDGSNMDGHENVPTDPVENYKYGLNILKDNARYFYDTELHQDMDLDELAKAFLAYNRGGMYSNVDQPWTTSPYPMNRLNDEFEQMQFPSTDAEPESVRGRTDDRPGALTMYVYLANQ